MAILALGVSYRRAPVDLLERLAFTEEDYPKAYRLLLESNEVGEGVILSTCNRVEVFAQVASYHAGFQELKRFLSSSREVRPEDFADPLYAHYEGHAAEHLFSVASGIDSVVLGEPQILTQVRSAFRRAGEEGAVGPVLSALFRAAIRTGRRARAETSISSSPAAFVEAGLELAERAVGRLSGRPAVIVGAGAMASLAAMHLGERGAGPIRILNRSLDRARRLAQRSGAEPATLDALAGAIGSADVVVSSTGASGVVIGRTEVERGLFLGRDRSTRPLFVLDLAVPRDVDPAVGRLPGVVLADLDDVKARVFEDRASESVAEVEQVRSIVAQEVDRLEAWRRAARLAPLMQALRDRGERVLAAELARLGPKLAGLSPQEREAVEALGRGVVAKLLHDPIVRLKALPAHGGGDGSARILAELFGLEPPPPG